jgi:GNAT superfamily N-acetyltransferase
MPYIPRLSEPQVERFSPPRGSTADVHGTTLAGTPHVPSVVHHDGGESGFIWAVRSQLERIRRIGVRVLMAKIRIRCWSTRMAIAIACDTEPREGVSAGLPLTFSVIPCTDIDERELSASACRGADLLFVEGLIRMYRKGPGEAIVARTASGTLAAVGLMSCADRCKELNAAAAGLYVPLAPDECWTEATYVLPAYRNQQVMTAILAAERDYLRERGIRSVYAIVDCSNAASLRAFARAGYAPTGMVRRMTCRFNRWAIRFGAIDEASLQRWLRATDGLARPNPAGTPRSTGASAPDAVPRKTA